MSISPDDLAWFREQWADQLTARCTIRRPTGEPRTDVDGTVAQQVETVGTNVPCKLTSTDTHGREVLAAETSVHITARRLVLPVGTDVAEHDLVEVTASAYDPSDVGGIYRVTVIDRREWQQARVCIVEEVSFPPSWVALDDDDPAAS